MTITKERLLKIQHWRETYGADSNVMLPAEEAEELARIALASLEAEPIGAFHIADQLVGGTSDYIKDGEWPIDNGVIEVYAAPPATVVPEKLPCSVELKPGLIIGKGCKTETLLTALRRRADYYAKIDTFTPAERAEHDASIEAFKAMLPTPADSQGRPRVPVVPPAIEPDYKVIKSILPTANPDEYACCIAADMWNACRAAMLQGVEQPQNARQNIPENIPDGNSPAIPDGWISCSERMPNDKQYVWCWGKSYGWTECDTFEGYYDCSRNKWWAVTDNGEEPASKVTHWMPLPEPPQEVNRG